jgi:hypothetical protein
MKLGWKELSLLERVKQRLENLGYEMHYSKYNYGLGDNNHIGVRCKFDKHLLHARDAEVFSGNLYQIAGWLTGIEHQKSYLEMLNLISDKKIHDAEQKKIRNLQNKAMIEKIKDPDKKIDKRTSDLISHPS